MPDPTQDELQEQLDEVNAQLAEMVGAANISAGGLSVDEKGLQESLMERKTSLEWRINNMVAGGAANDNMRGTSFGTGGAY